MVKYFRRYLITTARHAVKIEPRKYLGKYLPISLILTCAKEPQCKATENRFFAGSDQFLVCKTDSNCIKRIFFGPKKTHFADHILAQLPSVKPLIVHNYSNYQCCQHIRVTESYLSRSQLVYSSLISFIKHLFFACTEACQIEFLTQSTSVDTVKSFIY